MAWQTITESNVQTKLAGAELTALQSSALATGQASPLAETITTVIDEIRGYIAANHANTLGTAGTIPSKLVSAAVVIIRYRLCTRLPVKSLLDENRVREYQDAIKLLERVADGKFSIEDPSTGTENAAQIESSTQTRKATRTKLDGL
jgi:phage gp36-like protein